MVTSWPLSVLHDDGSLKRKVSLIDCFENSKQYRHILEDRFKRNGDIFHTNTLTLLDGRIADTLDAFKKGNVLTSFRYLNTIAVVDLEKEEIVWAYSGNFRRQHDPKILANGHLLLFDNNRGGLHQSGVQEYDPATMKLMWEFRGTPQRPFYSRSCGAAQRLPNGNTLITESDNGRAIEVSSDKEVVWEFYNPERAGEDRQYIATLFEMQRLPLDYPTHWVRGVK
jgi:hypothetical protein